MTLTDWLMLAILILSSATLGIRIGSWLGRK